jgi:hypothetical protein
MTAQLAMHGLLHAEDYLAHGACYPNIAECMRRPTVHDVLVRFRSAVPLIRTFSSSIDLSSWPPPLLCGFLSVVGRSPILVLRVLVIRIGAYPSSIGSLYQVLSIHFNISFHFPVNCVIAATYSRDSFIAFDFVILLGPRANYVRYIHSKVLQTRLAW